LLLGKRDIFAENFGNLSERKNLVQKLSKQNPRRSLCILNFGLEVPFISPPLWTFLEPVFIRPILLFALSTPLAGCGSKSDLWRISSRQRRDSSFPSALEFYSSFSRQGGIRRTSQRR